MKGKNNMLEKLKKVVDYTLFKTKFKTPPSLIFFVTSRCNARCKHCFYWRNLNKRKDLTFKEIEKLTKNLGPVDSLNISGGEPFLRKDLPEIINLFYLNNNLKVVLIPTNGLLPGRIASIIKEILKYAKGKLVILSFSLDGTEKVHDEMRGVKGSFQKVIESYNETQKLKRKHLNLEIQVNTVVTNANENDIKKLIDRLKEIMPDIGLFTLSFLRGDSPDKSISLPPVKNLKELERYRNQKIPPSSFFARLADKIIYKLKLKALKEKRQIIPCEAGRVIGVIEDNGDVKHCELLPPIGNIRRDDFSKIWNSAKSRRERQEIIEGRCWCTHECFLFPSFVAHPICGLKEVLF